MLQVGDKQLLQKIDDFLYDNKLIFDIMMVIGKNSHEKEEEKGFLPLPFQTQMSQQGHLEDKEFSPWIRKKTKRLSECNSNKKSKHEFLAKINFKHTRNENPQIPEKEEISTIRRNLEDKIKAERIHNQDYIQLIQSNRKAIEQKSYFQRRSKLGNFHQKPKYVQLNFEEDSKSILKASPYIDSPSTITSPLQTPFKKKQLNIIVRKTKKPKKDTNQHQNFSLTMTDFTKNSGFPHNKFYQTLELNIYPLSPKKRWKEEKVSKEKPKMPSKNNRVKYRSQSPNYFEKEELANDLIACKGQNLLATSYAKSRRQKLRQQLQENQMKEVIFLK